MNSRQNRTLQAFRRAYAWLLARQEELSTNPAIVALLARLLDVIGQLSTSSADQERHRVGSLERTAAAERVRRELWTYHMLPIVTIARAAAPTDPDLLADVRMPKTYRNNERMLASADAFAKAVAPVKDVFVKNGLAQDFIGQLVATAGTLRQLIDAHGSTRAERGATTAAVRFAVTDGKEVLRLIDNILVLIYRGGEELEGWAIAKHIQADPSPAVATVGSSGTQDIEGGTSAADPAVAPAAEHAA